MRNNPWLGLATYDEESIKQGYKFCGRERATKEFYSSFYHFDLSDDEAKQILLDSGLKESNL